MSNANEQAYPTAGCNYDGLTKRELFAAMAMQGICANDSMADGGLDVDFISEMAVEQADALLAELAKPKDAP